MRNSKAIAAKRAPTLQIELQAALSPGLYIRLLHEAAICGKMPLFKPDGSPTGEFSVLDTQQRIETAKYLVNKILPEAPRTEIHRTVDPLALENAEFRVLTNEDLKQIAALAAEPDPIPAAAS